MAQLRIPEDYAPGLVQIIKMSDTTVEELSAALARLPPSLNTKSISKTLSEKIKGVSEKDLRRIVRTLVSLYSVHASSKSTFSDFVEDIIAAMARSDNRDLANADKKEVGARLTKLLNSDALKLASKGLFLRVEHERVLCSARILTDSRTVYGEDPSVRPTGAVITHMLKLAYHHGDRLREIYLAMDAGDLRELRELLDRAEAKAKTLEAILTAAGLQVIS
jgi:hypothetical protein